MLVPDFALVESTMMYSPFHEATSPAEATGARHSEALTATDAANAVLRNSDMFLPISGCGSDVGFGDPVVTCGWAVTGGLAAALAVPPAPPRSRPAADRRSRRRRRH